MSDDWVRWFTAQRPWQLTAARGEPAWRPRRLGDERCILWHNLMLNAA